MQFNKILLVAAVLVPASLADLLCYHCEDCTFQAAKIQPCGFDDAESPVQTIPATITTTSFPWPTIVLTTAGDGDDEAIISKNPSDRPGASSTTPAVSGRPGSDKPNDGGEQPLLTPPTAPGTIYPVRAFEGVTPAFGETKMSYGCLTMKSVESEREVIRRGCVRLGLQKEEMCQSERSDSVQKCDVCTSQLCNH